MIFVVISAFQDEIWKGVACLFCQIYTLYYMITEYSGNYQIPVLSAYVIGALGAYGFSHLALSYVH